VSYFGLRTDATDGINPNILSQGLAFLVQAEVLLELFPASPISINLEIGDGGQVTLISEDTREQLGVRLRTFPVLEMLTDAWMIVMVSQARLESIIPGFHGQLTMMIERMNDVVEEHVEG
jgi:hypothetical protein